MPNPYTSVSISGYNASPPPDGGEQTSANRVEWQKHIDKIGDPLKTLAEAINTNVLAAWTSFLATAQTWTANHTWTSTDAGSSVGPILVLYRNSASPDLGDDMGAVRAQGNDSAGNLTTYADMFAEIVDPTDGAEGGAWLWRTIAAGTVAGRLGLRQGLFTFNATGGDQGADTINASNYFDDGVNISTLYSPDTENAIVTAEEFC